MSLAAILAAALALWGFGGVTVDVTFAPIPEYYPPWTVAYGAPGTHNGEWDRSSPFGLCLVWMGTAPEQWPGWSDESRVLVTAHELGHCWGLGHDEEPGSLMGSGTGTVITASHRARVREQRSWFPHRVNVPGLSH